MLGKASGWGEVNKLRLEIYTAAVSVRDFSKLGGNLINSIFFIDGKKRGNVSNTTHAAGFCQNFLLVF